MSEATHITGAQGGTLARAWQRGRAIDPRYLIAFLVTLVLATAQLRYHIAGGYDRLVLSLAVCTATEALLSIIYAIAFVFLLITDRDSLRSEKYSLHKMAIEHGLIGDSTLGVIGEPRQLKTLGRLEPSTEDEK